MASSSRNSLLQFIRVNSILYCIIQTHTHTHTYTSLTTCVYQRVCVSVIHEYLMYSQCELQYIFTRTLTHIYYTPI